MANIINLENKTLPENGFIFKHSTRCPISSRAAKVVKKSHYEGDIYWVDVVERRDLSNWIADELNVVHESPQLLYLKDGKVAKTWSHYGIDSECFKQVP